MHHSLWDTLRYCRRVRTLCGTKNVVARPVLFARLYLPMLECAGENAPQVVEGTIAEEVAGPEVRNVDFCCTRKARVLQCIREGVRWGVNGAAATIYF